MKNAFPKICILLCFSLTFLVNAQASCTRRAPSSTDCSTITGECDRIYDENSSLTTRPFPPPNTRTCYRTCFENGVCRSTPTVVHEQRLAVDQFSSEFRIQRIFSPRYGRGDYRKSTNCRYSIKCDPGQLLSYSVHSFHLESEGTCFERNECLDWVQVGLRNLGNSERFCGIGELNEIHADGAEEMTIEFASNRQTERGGFLYFITCINPGFDQNGINSGAVPSSQSILHNSFPFSTCTEPVDQSKRPTLAKPTTDVFDRISPLRTFVVKMSGFIFYKGTEIQIRDGLRVVSIIRGITLLEVANRFSTTAERHYVSDYGLIFKGYGTLNISRSRANFYQLGADPIFQPTPEETETILELEKVINTFLGDDDYDVLDRYDLEEFIDRPTLLPTDIIGFPTVPFPTVPRDFEELPTATIGPPIERTRLIPKKAFRPPTGRTRLIPKKVFGPVNLPEKETELASIYRNACNAVLRATACTYQALLLGKDCNTGLSLS